jgi:uncharacterized membrane protein
VIREHRTPIWRADDVGRVSVEGSRAPYVVLALATVMFAAVFSWLSVARHAAFQSHAFDLGNMDQAVWSTLHGHFLRFTDMDIGHAVLTSRLAIHVEPLLVVFAPLYLIHSGPETLLVAQSLIVATGAIPAYLMARAALCRVWLSLSFPLAYLLHPSLQNVLLDDFHAVALSAAFLLWAMYFYYRSRMVPFAIFAVLSMATKEEVGLVVACLGVWALVGRRPLTGMLCLIGGIGWFLVSLAVIIPHFNPSGHSPYLARYAYLGHGLTGIARGAVRHPGLVLRTLLSEPRLQYPLDLIHPLGFTSLLALPVLALALPVLLINMLSGDATMYSGFYQYSAETVPIVIVAAILGIAWIERRRVGSHTRAAPWLTPTLCGLVVLASLVDSRVYGFTPLADGYLVPTTGAHQTLEEHTLSLIPPRAVVAAADEIEPHLADRRWIYVLPTTHPRNGPRAGYLVLDASVPSLPITPRQLHAVARTSMRHGYGIRSASDGVLLLQHGRGKHTLPPAFYSFMFRTSANTHPLHFRWGPLRLTAVVVHPRSGATNRSRPAIGLETYWRTSAALPANAHITFHLSPTYNGKHPPYSVAWSTDTDSPTWDWLPLHAWPSGRTIRSDSLSLLPSAGSWGTVDLAVSVSGLGPAHSSGAGGTVIAPDAVRVSSITVRP